MTRAAAAVLLAAAVVGATLAASGRQTPQLVERDVFIMGTRARLATFSPSRTAGLDVLSRALGVLEATEAELSNWRPHSWISRFNQQPLDVPSGLTSVQCRMFTAVARTVRETDGAFDPAVGALIEAWGLHRGGAIPDAPTVGSALARTGWARLRFEQDACQLARAADVSIDTGAFGKGEALDRVASEPGFPWLIDLGGQIAVSGTPPGEDAWIVSVAHPRDRERPLLDVRLRHGSLSTSGSSERDVSVGGGRVGHILDPRTGRPAPFTGSVTVWHASALMADMLSTALYVMGPAQGLEWARSRDIAAAFFVPTASGRVDELATSQFTALVVSRRP